MRGSWLNGLMVGPICKLAGLLFQSFQVDEVNDLMVDQSACCRAQGGEKEEQMTQLTSVYVRVVLVVVASFDPTSSPAASLACAAGGEEEKKETKCEAASS